MTRRARKATLVLLAAALAACESATVLGRLPATNILYGTGNSFHWPVDRMPLRFWFNPGDSVGSYVTYALPAWREQFLYGEFDFQLVSDSSQADVIVQVDDPAVPTGSLATLPDSGTYAGCGGFTEPDSASDDGTQFLGHMRVHITWTYISAKTAADSARTVVCLARVVTHEIGHALGLQHSPDSTDIMFTFPRISLPSEGDRATLQSLYHTPAGILPPPLP